MDKTSERLTDSVFSSEAYDALEIKFAGIISNEQLLDNEWGWLDTNGNGKVSLAEVDKWASTRYSVLHHKHAMMRAYKYTINQDGDGDDWMQKHEFKRLLVNLLYFNKAFEVFDLIDTVRSFVLIYLFACLLVLFCFAFVFMHVNGEVCT